LRTWPASLEKKQKKGEGQAEMGKGKRNSDLEHAKITDLTSRKEKKLRRSAEGSREGSTEGGGFRGGTQKSKGKGKEKRGGGGH